MENRPLVSAEARKEKLGDSYSRKPQGKWGKRKVNASGSTRPFSGGGRQKIAIDQEILSICEKRKKTSHEL